MPLDFFRHLPDIEAETTRIRIERGSKYNQHGITPDDYLAASSALDNCKVIFLRLEALEDDPDEQMKIWPDLIVYAQMAMCQIENERTK